MNILITGASSGIGFSTAYLLSALPDVKLFLLSRDLEKLNKLKSKCLQNNPKANIELLPFDLNNLLKENYTFNLTCDHLDILINNAGYLVNKKFEELSLDELQTLSDINFLAPSRLIQLCLPKMGGDKSTHIVNISSMGGVQGSTKFAGLSLYSATKAALAVLTECLAVEFKDKNIFVNCLALGAVQTEMLALAFPNYKASITANEMATYIVDFAINGMKYFNGKIIPVAVNNP